MANSIDIEKFKGFEVELNIEEIIEKNSDEAAKLLQRISPDGVRRAKKYKDGWIYVIHKTYHEQQVEGVVWNETNWQLTWLLENGHLIVNKRGGIGWASPKKHIDKAYREQGAKFVKDMENIDIKIDFK